MTRETKVMCQGLEQQWKEHGGRRSSYFWSCYPQWRETGRNAMALTPPLVFIIRQSHRGLAQPEPWKYNLLESSPLCIRAGEGWGMDLRANSQTAGTVHSFCCSKAVLTFLPIFISQTISTLRVYYSYRWRLSPSYDKETQSCTSHVKVRICPFQGLESPGDTIIPFRIRYGPSWCGHLQIKSHQIPDSNNRGMGWGEGKK